MVIFNLFQCPYRLKRCITQNTFQGNLRSCYCTNHFASLLPFNVYLSIYGWDLECCPSRRVCPVRRSWCWKNKSKPYLVSNERHTSTCQLPYCAVLLICWPDDDATTKTNHDVTIVDCAHFNLLCDCVSGWHKRGNHKTNALGIVVQICPYEKRAATSNVAKQ